MIYYGLAIFSTGIFIVQFILSMFMGDLDVDSDVDIDGDGLGDFEFSSLFSFKGLIHFLIGFSWTMWLREGMEGSKIISILIALCVGAVFMIILALTYWLTMKLKNEIKPEKGNVLVHRVSEIYLNLQDGKYVVLVEINGAKRQLDVVSDSKATYSVGTQVEIIKYESGIYYIV